ncbi:hypothetical protein FOZ60_016474 [Perkinsus olseni]|uniref:Uncharacterized protein n=1 Tax=Perkinsus olseni TaxID=32597 RepID=A0A7J6P6L8_PEROL|nr:hypothetical protein FOZ60_016474 [Perkinsus olseni]
MNRCCGVCGLGYSTKDCPLGAKSAMCQVTQTAGRATENSSSSKKSAAAYLVKFGRQSQATTPAADAELRVWAETVPLDTARVVSVWPKTVRVETTYVGLVDVRHDPVWLDSVVELTTNRDAEARQAVANGGVVELVVEGARPALGRCCRSVQAVVVVTTTGDVVEEIVARALVRWILRALDVVVAEKSVTKKMMYHGQEEADARATMVDVEELESVDVQDLLGFGQHALAGIDADVDREVEVDTAMDCETTTSVGWYGRVPAVFELRTTLADEAREEVLAGQDVVRSGQAVVVVAATGDVVEEIVARALVRWILCALDVVVAEKKRRMLATMVDVEELESVDVQDLLGFGQHALAGIDADVDREVEVDTAMDCETTTSVGWYGRIPAVFELRTTLADEAREEALAGQDVVSGVPNTRALVAELDAELKDDALVG